MKYRINEAVICGINNPQLVINGWVESKAHSIVLKDNKEIVATKKIKQRRSYVNTFYFTIPLNKHTSVSVYFSSDDGDEFIENINSNKLSRIMKKINFRSMVDEIKYMFSSKEEVNPIFDINDAEKYNIWLKNVTFSDTLNFDYQPKISIVMPVYNVPGEYLAYCIDSILNQTYQNFEICIADDCSTNQDTIDTLHKYMEQDERIKVVFREKNGHISRATNSALELATGEFIGLMDNDDKLEMHALNEIVNVLNNDRGIDFIYTDEDKVDMEGNRSDPHFKSDFALDTLYGGNYICHFSVIRKTLIEKIGGFRAGYEGAQDFDLFLRLTDVTKNIYHIPKVLYHWRMIPGSTAVGGDGAKNYAGDAGKRALEDYFAKKNIEVNIDNFISTNYFVEYIVKDNPTVDVVVICENSTSSVNDLVYNLKNYNCYDNYELTVLNCTKEIIESNNDYNVYSCDEVNKGVNDLVELLNNDYVIFIRENCMFNTIDTIPLMVGYLQNEHIGIVSGKVINIQKHVIESGKFISNTGKIVDCYAKTYYNDYGSYGRLLIPYNYNAVSSRIWAIKKDNFDGLSLEYNYTNGVYDLCYRLIKSKYSNVCIPQIELWTSQESLGDGENTINDYDVKYDKYYNINLSMDNVFNLK